MAQGHRAFAAIAAALVAVGVPACSSSRQTAAASSAWVKINGVDAIRTDHVQCTQVQWFEMVDIGDNIAGAKLFIDETAATPNAKSVHIHNLGGFTGMYSEGDGGDADTTFTKERLTVAGTADGFNTHNPNQPATATFQVSVKC